jgi:simple sugar transport system ATP-binding protein
VTGATETDTLLSVRGLAKRYGHVSALRGVDLDVPPGRVVGLIGDNGAGKSTLVKILSGFEAADGGTVTFNGAAVEIGDPLEARRLGIETVYQDLALAPDLDAAGNLFLGREIYRPGLLGRLGVLDKARMRQQAEEHYARLGVELPDARAKVAGMSGGQRQGVAVARAVRFASELVFMDEPTAALGVRQSAKVLDLIRRVRDSGVAVVLVSHNMQDVLAVCDHIEVLRLGRRVASFDAGEADAQALVSAMTGAAATDEVVP